MSSFTAYAVGWHQDALGWKLWDKSKKPLTSEWYYDSGYQYYLKEDGYRATGWILIDNSWYYFDQKGHLATDKWIDDKYVDYSGKMLTDTRTPDGYYVGADGKWIENYQGGSGTAGAGTTAAASTGSASASANTTASGFDAAAMYSYAGSSYDFLLQRRWK